MSALASQCAQHSCDGRNLAVSGVMCSGVVIIDLVLALVQVQKRQDNRPQHLIHVRLADQVSLAMFDQFIEILRKMARRTVNFDIATCATNQKTASI